MAFAQLELRFWHGRDENALPAAERALAINPEMPEALCIKARYLEEEGRGEEGQQEIRRALALDPSSWEVNREAARMLFRHGKVREAIPYFEKAASLMDTDWHNPLMLTTCYQAIGDKDLRRKAAKISFERAERAIAKDPTDGQALAAGANALAVLGEKDRALEWIRRALFLDPDNLVMRYNLGCALIQDIGEIDEAIETLQPFFEKLQSPMHLRHLEVDPDISPIREDSRFKEMLAAARKRLGMAETVADA
jgi:adenylate cyclase